MAKLIARCVAWVLVSLAAAGCGSPAPPQQANAVLPGNRPIYGESQKGCDMANAVVVAQCTQKQEYAKIVSGNWEQHWCMTRWQVVRVERGRWPDVSVDFIFYDGWPTPESGIVLKAAPVVYYRGALMAFYIDTLRYRPVIVAQEERSHISPHGKLRPPPADFYNREKNSIYDQVITAATRFADADGSEMLPRRVVEEYDGFYVVEVGNTFESMAVTVDKSTYRVQPVEPAHK